MSNAIIVKGGWKGHQPDEVSDVFKRMLEEEGFAVEVHEELEVFSDLDYLNHTDLIVPVWTMGVIESQLVKNVMEAVGNGTGMAGCHGGMCDSFRNSTEWQFLTGGQWVSHPGGDDVEYTVNIKRGSSPITEGIRDFKTVSEQYYVHIDPCIEVLATTRFPSVNWYNSSNGEVDVPVMWTKRWGHGRVFYSSLGHHADIFDIPEAYETMKRGMLWAAQGSSIAKHEKLSGDEFKSEKKMF